ncbi:hypothetical protein KDH_03180 [Dictyobacter sp. S3.2.2.5]|uniref:HTH luxR-type domain-containing protein n=1 Tax=Dictyobacter halimunensis TaxID=3026934 RepID=A0ABQ6FHF1_9CHLR|nr:hypothetical protein KDH_03180 [Dictyobacter sp. S3.2.2.5]
MPRRTPYLLRWSESKHNYEISSERVPVASSVAPDSPAWREWLDGIHSFAFHSRSGIHYTVRRETIQQRGSYWYGYRFLHGRTVKRYLGRTSNLSTTRLEEIAGLFEDTAAINALQPHLPSAPLLISRLHPPRLPLGLVERPHLLAQLDGWRAHKLTLVWAPAGFGKTTLINSWLARSQARSAIPNIAWIALEASDNDPVQFWRSIIEACQNWQGEVGKVALAYLNASFQPPFVSLPLETILTFFLNDLANQVSAGVLVLDDYHVITEPRLHEALTFFIEHLPTSLHLVIMTRSEPPLPLTRWRAQGDMQELHTMELRFSPQESAAFLQCTMGATFSERTVVRLNAHLQGWAAGLRLLILAGQPTQAEVERHLTSLDEQQRPNPFHQQLLDYFVGEVLGAQPEPLQRFLLRTSLLNRLTGPLCATITSREDSSTLLGTIERAGLFLEALDEGAEPWYRYHTLFAETMRVEARRRLNEETIHTIYSQASHWYEQHALPSEAIEAALSAHEAERAGTLIEQFGSEGQRFDLPALHRWLQQIPESILSMHPALYLYSAIAHQFIQPGPLSEMEQKLISELLSRAEAGWRYQNKPAWVGLVYAMRALGASLPGSIPTPEIETNAATALALLPHTHSDGGSLPSGVAEWRIICLGLVAAVATHQGRVDEARQQLLEALALSQIGDQQFTGEIRLRLAAACMALGKLHQAGEYYRQALASASEHNEHEEQGLARLGLARLALEWNDLAAAQQHINTAIELAHQGGEVGNKGATYLMACLHAARDQHGPALLRLAALIAHLQAIATPAAQELQLDALALQARLQLAAGDHLSARSSLQLLEQTAHEPSFAQQMMIDIIQARRLLLEKHMGDAIDRLEQLLATAQARQHVRSELEILLLLTRACAEKKQKDQAWQWLWQALSRAHGEGFLRVFLDEGKELSSLLRSLLPTIREKTLRAYGQMIMRASILPPEIDAPSSFDSLTLAPLSAQERRVLHFLATGRTNPEIADELVISVNTVKDHVKHLYQKLGVNNRHEARKAARQLGQI